MKIRKTFIITLLTISATFGSLIAMAQKDTIKLRQEVEVTKAYQPTVSEAEKINDIPKIKAEPVEAPTFDYSIFSKPIFSTFDPSPVAAAKMVGEPKPTMEMGLLKLGLGNYLTPYGELFFNSQPDKNSNFGMHFKHLSSYGKIKLLNDDRVKAPESENVAEIFGEKFFRRSTLSGSLSFDRKAFTYYGYTGDLLTDEMKDAMIPYYQDKQYFAKGTADISLKSGKLPATDFNYDFGLNYHFVRSKTGQTENQLLLSGDVHKKFGKTTGLLNASLTYYTADSLINNFSGSFGPKQQILIKANPSLMWKTDVARLQVGLNSTIVFDDDADAAMLFWPKVKAEWSPVPQILTLFAGVDGHLQHNTYSNIATENPYVDPFHDVKNTNYKYIVSGGLKGKLSQKTNYVAEASYSKVNDQHFYMLYGRDVMNLSASGPRSLNNTFDWVYDDLKLLKISAEVMHSVSENFSLHLQGNYYSYELETISKAWQMPNFDATFSGIYKPTEQLKFTTDIFVVGKRTALVSEPVFSSAPSMTVAMDPIIDLNVGGEYQFNKSLSFFAKLNNFGFQRYEQWLGYTNRSLNWLAGISYSF
ncbi:MAG TPA: hypothetical protein DHV48_01935 [Prolixibacteraceae bacterium]|nr:hypothetical protein [Prolixibacteraceae bacterium]